MIAPTYFDSGLGRSAGNTVAIVRKLPKFFAILLMGCFVALVIQKSKGREIS
jgi:hypothetical protein